MKYILLIAFLILPAIHVEQGYSHNNNPPVVQKMNDEGIGGLLIAQSDAELEKMMNQQDTMDKKNEGPVGKTSEKVPSVESETSASEDEKVWTDKKKADLFVMLGGLILGLLLGIIVQRSQFCMSNAFTFIRIMGSFLKFKSYMVALLVAILGVYLLSMVPMTGKEKDITHLVEPLLASQPTFLPTADSFNLLGFVIGGYVFGMGIVWAGGCASRILVRTGEGNLGSLISVIAFGLAAGTALQGHVGYVNANYFQKWSKTATLWFTDLVGINSETFTSIPILLADIFGAKNPIESSAFITPIIIGLFAVLLAFWFIKSKDKDDFWGMKWPLTGLGIGLLIVAGWAITGYATTHWNPNEGLMAGDQIAHNSLTFANPNFQLMDYLFKSSARFDPSHPFLDYFWGEKVGSFFTSLIVSFGIASVVGAVLGSFLSAKVTRSFSWVIPPDKNAFLGHIAGGIMMGLGAVLSLGCNIGQGLSGISVLGLGGVITVIFIILGSWTTVGIRGKWDI